MSNKDEKMQVTLMSLACVIVTIIPYLTWFDQLLHQVKSPWYWVVQLVLSSALWYMARKNYKDAVQFETETNGKRILECVIAVASFCWAAGWAAYQNELIK